MTGGRIVQRLDPIAEPDLFSQPKEIDNSIAEYFGESVSSPIVDDSTGNQTIIGKDQIIEAVSKYWGVPVAQAALACMSAFEPKL
jgi:hypothetical protein